jgi:hypothetical protein
MKRGSSFSFHNSYNSRTVKTECTSDTTVFPSAIANFWRRLWRKFVSKKSPKERKWAFNFTSIGHIFSERLGKENDVLVAEIDEKTGEFRWVRSRS